MPQPQPILGSAGLGAAGDAAPGSDAGEVEQKKEEDDDESSEMEDLLTAEDLAAEAAARMAGTDADDEGVGTEDEEEE
jgi:hypothetical protein